MERIEIIEGEIPVLLISPHGVDDINTNEIAKKVAENFGTYAILNKGWKRGTEVDYLNEIANCNDVPHLHEDVVKEEFLDPILRNVNRIKKRYEEKVLVLIIHGCGDHVRNVANDPGLDLIVGFGDGNPPSYSCNIRLKDAFVHHLKREKFGVYEGKPRGNYSGRSKYNLNQLFRRWYPDNQVNSLQIEIVKELRSKERIEETAAGLIGAIDALMLFDDTITILEGETKKI